MRPRARRKPSSLGRQRVEQTKTMNTRDQYTDELVSAYFDGELSGDERARVEQLLAQGGRESDWLEEIESLRQDMQLLPPKRLGSDFTQRTIHAARQSAAEAGRSTQPLATALAERDANYGWIGWVSGAAVLAAALLLAVFLMNSSTTPKPDETAITGAFAVAKKQRSKTSDEPIRDPSPQKSNLKKQGTDSPPLVGDEATKGHSTPDVGTVDKDGKSDKREDGKSDKRENGKSDKRENGKSDKRENGKSDKRENGKSDKRENGNGREKQIGQTREWCTVGTTVDGLRCDADACRKRGRPVRPSFG